MSQRSKTMVGATALAGAALVLVAGSPWFRPRLLFNATASASMGFYRVSPGCLAVGDLIAVSPPPKLAQWLAARRYLPMNVPLLKVIAAGPGQFVCGRDGVITIDGKGAAKALSRDRWGRTLTAFSECRRLRDGEVFLLNREAPASLDSRYFGPVPASGVLGRATPLWTWRAPR